jgi:cytochrome c peroxidase
LVRILVEFRSLGLLIGLVFTTGVGAADHQWRVPEGYPSPALRIDQALVDLGRHLFYETRLSADETLSCASCHDQIHAFADNRVQPLGIDGNVLPRHAMALINLAYQPRFGWADHDVNSLSLQMQGPLFSEAPVEMGANRNRDEILRRLRHDQRYPNLFLAAFGERDNDINFKHITAAIEAFELTLISMNSPFDKWVLQDQRPNEAAVRGFELFRSEKFGCSGCHQGLNFSSEEYFRTGVDTADRGLEEATKDEQDAFKFRVPSLRNIMLTAPYMHRGQLPDIRHVLEHYAAGPNSAIGLSGFEISETELKDMVAFLSTLTDTDFITDPALGRP